MTPVGVLTVAVNTNQEAAGEWLPVNHPLATQKPFAATSHCREWLLHFCFDSSRSNFLPAKVEKDSLFILGWLITLNSDVIVKKT
jgi:hypothetical protein